MCSSPWHVTQVENSFSATCQRQPLDQSVRMTTSFKLIWSCKLQKFLPSKPKVHATYGKLVLVVVLVLHSEGCQQQNFEEKSSPPRRRFTKVSFVLPTCQNVFFIKCVIHIQHYFGCNMDFFLKNLKKRKRVENPKLAVFKVTNYVSTKRKTEKGTMYQTSCGQNLYLSWSLGLKLSIVDVEADFGLYTLQ